MCKTCHVPLCNDCMISLRMGPHGNHELENMQVTVMAMMKEYTEFNEEMNQIEVECNKAYDDIEPECKVYKDDAIATTDLKAERVITETVQWRSSTVKKITGDFEEVKRDLLVKQADLQPTREKMKMSMKRIKQCLDDTDTEHFRKELDVFREHLKKINANIPNAKVTFGQLSQQYGLDLGNFSLQAVYTDGEFNLLLL